MDVELTPRSGSTPAATTVASVPVGDRDVTQSPVGYCRSFVGVVASAVALFSDDPSNVTAENKSCHSRSASRGVSIDG